MKVLTLAIFVSAFACMVRVHAPVPRRTELIHSHSAAKKEAKRKLVLDDLDDPFGDPIEKLGQVDQKANIIKENNRRNAQMREAGSFFGDVDFTIEKLRDQVSQKLDQLNSRLQSSNEEILGIVPRTPVASTGLSSPSSLFSPQTYTGSITNSGSSDMNQSNQNSIKLRQLRMLKNRSFA